MNHLQARLAKIDPQYVNEPGPGCIFLGFVTANNLEMLDSWGDDFGFWAGFLVRGLGSDVCGVLEGRKYPCANAKE